MTNRQRPQYGFNLIELMIMLSIIAILAGIAVPSFTSMLDRRAISAQANHLVRSINLARSNAVNNGQRLDATMERTSATVNDWSSGWRVFTDNDSNIATAYDAANDELLYEISIETRAISILSDAADRIMFNAQGRLVNGATVKFAVCDTDHSTDIDGSLVTINAAGSTSVSTIAAANKAADCVLP